VIIGSFETAIPALFAPLLVLAAWLGAGLMLARRGQRALLLGACWFCMALLPSLAVAVRGIAEAPVAERYLYLPSVGAALAFGGALALLGRRHALATYLPALLVLVVCSRATLERCAVWRDDLALWSSTVEVSPLQALAWHQLGLARQRQGLHAEAVDAFERALSLEDRAHSRARIHNNLGRSLVEVGRLKQGEAELRKAIELWPEYEMPPFNLAMVARIRERAGRQAAGEADCALLDQAHSLLLQAIQKSPTFLQAREEALRCAVDLAACLRAKGDPAAARAVLLQAREAAAELKALDPGRTRSTEREIEEALLGA
jgi:tetratricopeptide (TPR) repeat protein